MLMKDLKNLGYAYELSGSGIAILSLETSYFKAILYIHVAINR